MERMELWKLAGIGVLATLLAIKLGTMHPEYSLYISITACLAVMLYSMRRLDGLIVSVRRLEQMIPLGRDYLKVLLKLVGVSYLCDFAACLCRDGGQSAIAGQIETAGKITILALSMPTVIQLIRTVTEAL